MAGLLLCLWGEPHEPQQAAKRANRFGIQGAGAFEQVDRCSINKFVVEDSAFGQVGISTLQEGQAFGVVQESLRLEEEHRKEVAPWRRSLCAKAQGPDSTKVSLCSRILGAKAQGLVQVRGTSRARTSTNT